MTALHQRPLGTRGVWSTSEHERFLEAVALYPQGPWQLITAHVGTRSAKQVQTHSQKYQHKLLRHQRGLLKVKTKTKRPEHRVDVATIDSLTKGVFIRSTPQRHTPPSPTSTARSCRDRMLLPAYLDGAMETTTHYSPSNVEFYRGFDTLPVEIEPTPFTPSVDCGRRSTALDYSERDDEHQLWEIIQLLLACGTPVDGDGAYSNVNLTSP